MQIIENNIYSWADWDSVDELAKTQVRNTSRLPIVAGRVMLMPDAHGGIGACVGSVVPTRKAIVPASVGVDIGCGMAAVQLSLTAKDLPNSLDRIRSRIESEIPVGAAMHDPARLPAQVSDVTPRLWAGLKDVLESAPGLLDKRKNKSAWALQVGTLGGGNHFIELCLDEQDRVWAMLHSGSRGIGNSIGEYYISKAREIAERMDIHVPDRDLAWLPEGTPEFSAYWRALEWAQNYAQWNRTVMFSVLLDALQKHLPTFTTSRGIINCHHNYVAREAHNGEEVYVTRKGAIRAGVGEMGIIPGSMGTASYIVEGLGNEESFCSCSHGAGRIMSRGEAKRRFTQDDLIAQTAGIECRKDAGVVDEIPGAYKNIDEVMERQKDLVRPVHKLRQVLCVKG